MQGGVPIGWQGGLPNLSFLSQICSCLCLYLNAQLNLSKQKEFPAPSMALHSVYIGYILVISGTILAES